MVLQDLRALHQLDGPAREAGVARDERAAIGRIVEHLAADRDRLELAEVEVVYGLPAGAVTESVPEDGTVAT